MKHLYQYWYDVETNTLPELLESLPVVFDQMLIEHFDEVVPGEYNSGVIRPKWLNRARFFGATGELHCRRKGERLWIVLKSDEALPVSSLGVEHLVFDTARYRHVNLWGERVGTDPADGPLRWYEGRLMKTLAYPLTTTSRWVDMHVKDYLDVTEHIIAQRFVAFVERDKQVDLAEGLTI